MALGVVRQPHPEAPPRDVSVSPPRTGVPDGEAAHSGEWGAARSLRKRRGRWSRRRSLRFVRAFGESR